MLLQQLLLLLPAASVVVSSASFQSQHRHNSRQSLFLPQSFAPSHQRYFSPSSFLPFSIDRGRIKNHLFAITTRASRRQTIIGVSRSNTGGDVGDKSGSIDTFYNNIYSPDIPYETLPLTEVMQYLAPPPSTCGGGDGLGSNCMESLESLLPSLPLLSDAQANQRLLQLGPNTLPTSRPQLSLWETWWKQFEEDVLAKILACAALVSVISSLSDVWNDANSNGVGGNAASAAVGDGGVGDISSLLVHSLIEPLAIIAILLLNAGVGAWQEISARRSLEALEAMQPRLTTVLRRRCDDGDVDDATTATNPISNSDHCNGNDDRNECNNNIVSDQDHPHDHTTAPAPTSTARWVPNYDATRLVPGDIIRLRAGNAIPADARLLSLQSSSSSGSSMDVDESSLTGESGSVMKYPGNITAVGSTRMQGVKYSSKDLDDVVDEKGNGSIKQEVARVATITTTTTTTTTPTNPIPIQDQSSMLFSGCLITRGSGIALVVRTGSDTQMGKIRLATIEAECDGVGRRTPLGEQLHKFGRILSYAIGGICVAVWIASIPHFSDPAFATPIDGAVYYVKVGVALGVAAIPEGLPSAITLCLSLGARRMAGRNAIVRRLASVETLGCTSVICTDKTGTLTTNQMTAVSFLLLENNEEGDQSVGIVEHEVTGYSYNPVGSVVGLSREETISYPLGSVSDACEVMALCNDARLFIKDDDVISDVREKPSIDDMAVAQFAIEGEPTEAALLCLVEKMGPRGNTDESGLLPTLSTLASQNFDFFANRWGRVATLEFDRKRKSMGVLVKERNAETRTGVGSDGDCRYKLLVKGAPGTLLDRCSHVKLREGRIIPMSSEVRGRIESAISSIGDRALRCIALAVKDGDSLDANLSWKAGQSDKMLIDSSNFLEIESGLTFVGLVAIKDPPRLGVSKSIESCKRAGIRVIMITGDAKATAVAIAKDVHIFSDHDAAMKAFESREFFAMPHSMQLELLKNDNMVICRAEPADKRRLVKMLQLLGEIPAMTGDGVNDAPALVQASIGIAMGISGTEVAKEASDMVLVDDNFSTIVNAVEEGRCIYANMQAFINFLITCNIGEVIGVFLASILGYPQLLSPLHLLWLNLVTDGFPATALGFNPPDPDLMNKKPRPISEELLTPTLILRYSSAGLYIGVATVGIYASYFLDHGVSLDQLSSWSTCSDSASCSIYTDLAAPQTLAMTTMVTMELLKALCTVSVNSSILKIGPHKNPWLLLGVAVPFALNLAIIYTPAFQRNFGLVSLTVEDWVHVLMWSSPIILIDELQKFASRYQDKQKVLPGMI